MKLRIAICEDDPVQRRNLKCMIEKWGESRSLELRLFSYEECSAFLYDWEERMDFDLALLDIDLGKGLTGMELAEKIRLKDQRLTIIFVTGLAEYMSRGYDVQAFHFLVKPVEEERMGKILDKALNTVEKRESVLLLEDGSELERIPVSQILYTEAFSHTVALYLAPEEGRGSAERGAAVFSGEAPAGKAEVSKNNGKIICREAKMSLGELEEKLQGEDFFRCHRSYLVHLSHIRKIEKNQVILDWGAEVPVSRDRRKGLYQAFMEYHKGRTEPDDF